MTLHNLTMLEHNYVDIILFFTQIAAQCLKLSLISRGDVFFILFNIFTVLSVICKTT